MSIYIFDDSSKDFEWNKHDCLDTANAQTSLLSSRAVVLATTHSGREI